MTVSMEEDRCLSTLRGRLTGLPFPVRLANACHRAYDSVRCDRDGGYSPHVAGIERWHRLCC